MKVILYMAATINGIIAKDDDSAFFITPTESSQYVEVVKNAGALIVGRRTYEILSTQPEFQEFIQANVKVIAVSKGVFGLKDASHRIALSPEEALAQVSDHTEIIIAGGGMMNAAFFDAKLIDEIYLDIEPAVVSEGIPLFKGGHSETKLKFLGSKVFGEDEIQLHYAVIK